MSGEPMRAAGEAIEREVDSGGRPLCERCGLPVPSAADIAQWCSGRMKFVEWATLCWSAPLAAGVKLLTEAEESSEAVSLRREIVCLRRQLHDYACQAVALSKQAGTWIRPE